MPQCSIAQRACRCPKSPFAPYQARGCGRPLPGPRQGKLMFQAFDAPPSINETPTRVGRLRELLARLKIDAALVPRADEHQSEYVPPSAERLKWLTGFSGSAGSAVVTRESAALFVDGRYTVQSRQQVHTGLFEILQTPQNTPADWLVKTLTAGCAVVVLLVAANTRQI